MPYPVAAVRGAVSGGGGLTFLLRDDFLVDAVAPLTSPRTADPGPGTLTLTDASNKLSVSGNKLQIASKTTDFTDPRAFDIARSYLTGRTIIVKINYGGSVTGFGTLIGYSADGAAWPGNAGIGNNGGLWRVSANANVSDVGAVSTNTEYTVAVIQRTGSALFIVNGKLLWVLASQATGSWLAGVGSGQQAGANSIDFIRVLDLPAPFDTDYGLATQRIASPIANDTIVSQANAVIEHTWTAVTGETLELSTRRTDDNNRWIVRGDQAGSTVKLIEVVAGVETERASAAQTWTNTTAYRVMVIQDDNIIRVYVANALKWTYSSASFNNTATGIKTNKAGTNLIAWPRTLTGAAAALLDASIA